MDVWNPDLLSHKMGMLQNMVHECIKFLLRVGYEFEDRWECILCTFKLQMSTTKSKLNSQVSGELTPMYVMEEFDVESRSSLYCVQCVHIIWARNSLELFHPRNFRAAFHCLCFNKEKGMGKNQRRPASKKIYILKLFCTSSGAKFVFMCSCVYD